MILGLSFSLVCALGTNLSSLFKAHGAVLARPIQVRHPLRSAADLFRQRWFAVGWILALFAWGLHIEAIKLAPLVSVQSSGPWAGIPCWCSESCSHGPRRGGGDL